MTEQIRELYKEAGLNPPNGKGVHTEKFHKCVVDVKKKGTAKSPYAVCMASIGPEKAIKKTHLRIKGVR